MISTELDVLGAFVATAQDENPTEEKWLALADKNRILHVFDRFGHVLYDLRHKVKPPQDSDDIPF